MPATTQVDVRRLAGALGAEVNGLDLRTLPDPATFAAIKAAFLEHQVLCIRGQAAMTPDDHLAFGALWGDVSVHPYVPSIEGYPGIMRIYDPNPITQTWHADTTHMKAPPALTLLLARTLPPVGGDTMFASAYAAYESLSPALQQTLRGLRAVHHGTELAAAAGLATDAVTTTHPVVRTPTDAATVAELLVEAALAGVDSHGSHLVSMYVNRLRSGQIRPRAEVTVERDDGSTIWLDAGLGLGQPVGLRAMALAVERSEVH